MSRRDLTTLENHLAKEDFEIIELRGKRVENEKTFFEEAAASFQLPGYFGRNWDAFEECLSDELRSRAKRIAVIWSDANHAVRTDLQCVLDAVSVFHTVARELDASDSEGPVQFEVFLAAE